MKIKYTTHPRPVQYRIETLLKLLGIHRMVIVEFNNIEDFNEFTALYPKIKTDCHDRPKGFLKDHNNYCVNLIHRTGNILYNGNSHRKYYEEDKDYFIIKYTEL